VKELNLFSMAVPHAGLQAIDALTQGEVGKDIFKILSSKDVVPWHGGKTAFREVTNSKRSIKTPDDLKG